MTQMSTKWVEKFTITEPAHYTCITSGNSMIGVLCMYTSQYTLCIDLYTCIYTVYMHTINSTCVCVYQLTCTCTCIIYSTCVYWLT